MLYLTFQPLSKFPALVVAIFCEKDGIRYSIETWLTSPMY